MAIKLLHPDAESDQLFFERFQREKDIGMHLDHPGVVKVLASDHGRQDYLVAEWVEGRKLRVILQEQQKLSLARATRITREICGALEYIHNHGVVHRDLKPENVIVDSEDHIKLINFGLAAQTGARRITFVRFSQVAGSPGYISPEQAKGKRGDARSDLYSLGIMLYEMVTGRMPFEGSNSFALVNSRLTMDPVPPREIDPSISTQLQEVIYRAMEREPQYRYPSAHEFGFDLEHLDQVGVADRPELKNWRKGRNAAVKKVLVYAVLVLIPLAIFGVLLYFARR